MSDYENEWENQTMPMSDSYETFSQDFIEVTSTGNADFFRGDRLDNMLDEAQRAGVMVNEEKEEWLNMHDEGWSDWVMDQLDSKEKSDGKPTCDGLRRVAIMLWGPMNILPPQVHHYDGQVAAVTSVIQWPNVNGEVKQVSGSAEVTPLNTDEPFSKFPLATAETRAISRALRFALNLKKVVTAEEISKKANILEPVISDVEGGPIDDIQIKYIDRMCKKLDIDPRSYIESIVSVFGDVEELTHEDGQEIVAQLGKAARSDDEGALVEFGSYDSDWKKGE